MHTAAFCEPIVNAYAGFYFNSSLPEGQQSRLDEAQARMSLKSEQWTGNHLSPAFHFAMMEGEWEFSQTLPRELTEDSFAHQDFYVMFMGL